MSTADRLLLVHRALREAPAHALVPALERVLGEVFGVRSARLLLADYGLTTLRPWAERSGDGVDGAPLIPIGGSPPGRAFLAQEPVLTGPVASRWETAHLPVSARGDRWGVLEVNGTGTASLAELREAAAMLAHELPVADRTTDTYLRGRRTRRLTLAAEMQWELLPGRSCAGSGFELGAQLEPAYAVRGDSYDWSVGPETLAVGVTTGSGYGVRAATLTTLATSAVRNARRSGAGLTARAELANQAVWGAHAGKTTLACLLLDIDLRTGEVDAVDAGSPWVLLMRGTTVERVRLDAQFALGTLEDTRYVPERFRLEPGDRLVVVSDGVHATRGPGGEAFGEGALAASIRRNRLVPPPAAARGILRDLAEHRVGDEPEDDSVTLCLDWWGRDSAQSHGRGEGQRRGHGHGHGHDGGDVPGGWVRSTGGRGHDAE